MSSNQLDTQQLSDELRTTLIVVDIKDPIPSGLTVTYTTVLHALYPGTIQAAYADYTGVNGTFTVSINGAPVTGINTSAVTAGSKQGPFNATGNNTVAVGDSIEVTFTIASGTLTAAAAQIEFRRS